MMGKIMALIVAICSAFTPIGQILYGFWFDKYADNLIIIYICHNMYDYTGNGSWKNFKEVS